jgi:SMI1 / KNR4 family (SUKH-1)
MISTDDIKGMTDDEVSHLEHEFKIKLPAIYKQFLSVCGNDCGELIASSVIYCSPHLSSLPEEVQEMIEEYVENTYDPIPDNVLFFASDRGVCYWYFVCDDNPDPAVWLIAEKNKEHLLFVNLSDFIIPVLNESLQAWESYEQRKANS